jgi:2'-5' RNA ligase
VSADAPKITEYGPQTARIFFALWPPAEVADSLGRLARALAVSGGRPSRPETLHLTLAFLGQVALSDIPTLIELAHRVRGNRFDLVVDRLGYWSHNQLLWASCSVVPNALLALVAELRQVLRQAGFHSDQAVSGYFPHLTLMRRLLTAPDCSACLPPLSWTCHEFVLVRSRLDQVGAAYEVLARFPLSGTN